MQGKTKAESSIVMSQRMFPQDANPSGNVHGGVILKCIDTAAATVALRHARGNVVTASLDRMDFLRPIHVGEVAFFKASLNYVGTSSMEVGVRVDVENVYTGEVRYTNSAYLTFVALDAEGKPVQVAPLILEDETDKRRWDEALARRESRRKERARERAAHKPQES